MRYPKTILLVYQAFARAIASNYDKALRELGYGVISCGYNWQEGQPNIECLADSDISDIVAAINPEPDIVIYFESRGFFPKGWEKLYIPKIFYSTEGDVYLNAHQQIVDFFDILFSSNKVIAEHYTKQGYLSHWLPLAVDPSVHQPMAENSPSTLEQFSSVVHTYDIVFVGTLDRLQYQERARLLHALQKTFQVKILTHASPLECAQLYAQSHMVLNKNLTKGYGVNTRPFEVLACKRLLLTDENPLSGIAELFQDRQHLVYYTEQQDLLEKVSYFLEHSEEREAIAQSGYELVLQKHTYTHRSQEMLSLIREATDFGMVLRPEQKRLYSSPEAIATRYATFYCHEHMFEASLRLLDALPDSAPMLALRGLVYFYNQSLPEALVCFERALEIEPNQVKWLYHYAVTAFKSNHYKLCREILDRLEPLAQGMALEPELVDFGFLLGPYALKGTAYCHEHLYDQAQACFLRALASPGSYHPDAEWYILYLLAECHLAQDDKSQAEICAEKSLHKNPYIEQTYVFLAHLYLQTHKKEAALAILSQAEKLLPSPSTIMQLLATIKV